MSNPIKWIVRYTAGERINHWLIALTFVLLALSGLAIFHPSMNWLMFVLGGGPWTRILHPIIGVLMFVCFSWFAIRLFRFNLWHKRDTEWLTKIGDVISNREDRLPEVGKYNAGQKLLFFTLIFCMIALMVSGLIMWRAYFSFSVPVIRIAVVVHAVSAFVLITSIIVHIYAAIWVKGSIQAMVRGVVSWGWAWKHHRAWFREVHKDNKP